ncbi:hypothetical protein [Enterococcus cecorum]|uniref:hypothetical protein n=1 Tax=Enterococcus cecorum TaxID=44008 RepID=UPI0032C4A3AC
MPNTVVNMLPSIPKEPPLMKFACGILAFNTEVMDSVPLTCTPKNGPWKKFQAL